MTEETDELREQIKAILLEHTGADDTISSREISNELGIDEVESFPVTRGLIREIVEEDGVPIAGHSNGYFVIETEEELEDYIDTLDSRILKTAERKALVTRAAAKWHGFDADTEDTESTDIQDFL
jgi:hypothetical protein